MEPAQEARPTTPSTQLEWDTLSKEGKLPLVLPSGASPRDSDEDSEEEEDVLRRPFKPIEAMLVADSFSLPALSDDESDDDNAKAVASPEARGLNPAIQGRSLRAATRTMAGCAGGPFVQN